MSAEASQTTTSIAATVMVPVPERGRRFTAERPVRWGDTDRHGRLRLDALARFLQDVANDDTRDAGFDAFAAWVVRRTTVVTHQPAVLGEELSLTTFNGGTGSRWAERRTSIHGTAGAHVEVAALWVYVDPASGRPARLTPAFHEAYDEAAGGRTVQARLRHGPPPAPDGEPGSEVESRPWPLRSTDIDRLAHVNNAATWAAVEDELDRRGLVAGAAELEYPDALAPRSSAELRVAVGERGALALWLLVADKVVASARVEGRPA